MEYVQKIGSIIGHQPLILVAATTLVFDEQNRLLMQRRTENGMWGVPGGYMDLGEKIEDTARRETLGEDWNKDRKYFSDRCLFRS